jgi:hypothetical protein
MTAHKRQHFVPQFYLRLFSAGRQYIRCFNKSRGLLIEKAPIKNQCAINNYYDWHQGVERSLGQVEGQAASVIRKLASALDFKALSPEEMTFLTMFIAIQSGRTKVAGDSNDAMTTHYFHLMAEGAPELAGINPKDFVVKNTYPAALPLGAMISGADRLNSLGAALLLNRTKFPFFCSDNPVIRYNSQAAHVRHQGVTGLESPGLQIIFPIAPDIAIYLYDQDVYAAPSNTGVRFIREKDAIRIALLHYLWSDENVYLPQGFPSSIVFEIHEELASFVGFERLSIIESEPSEGPDGQTGSVVHQFHPHAPIEARFQFSKVIAPYDDDRFSRFLPRRERLSTNDEQIVSYKVKPYKMHEHLKGTELRRIEKRMQKLSKAH